MQAAAPAGDITTLTLSAALAGIYDASTVGGERQRRAGHQRADRPGDPRLGRRDQSALQFTLKQAPVTYLPAPNGSGSQSTLQVWVNNLQWQEAANLLTAGPADRVFVTSVNVGRQHGGRVRQRGAGCAHPDRDVEHPRDLPEGDRQREGMVSAGQLTQPLDRPQGLSSVTNPSAATGGADPATADQARASAPLPTLTDRPGGLARGLPELRARLRRHRQGAGHLDLVRRHPRRLPDRGRRERHDAEHRRSGGHLADRGDRGCAATRTCRCWSPRTCRCCSRSPLLSPST